MEPNTKIIWHEGIPSFERLKGNILLSWWKGASYAEVATINRQKDYDSYSWSRLIKFAILSEEVSICKWKLDEEGIYSTDCGHEFFFDSGTLEENGAKFCQYCGSTIKPVERIKPLALEGITPKFSTLDKPGYYAIYQNNGVQISLAPKETKEEAVKEWNEIRNKLEPGQVKEIAADVAELKIDQVEE